MPNKLPTVVLKLEVLKDQGIVGNIVCLSDELRQPEYETTY